MKQTLDIENWSRKDHFDFFKQFEEPFFGVTVNMDCTIAFEKAKAAGVSFFLWYLYRSLFAANAIEPFKYRIEENNVIVYDAVHASPTINRPDGTFGFSYLPYQTAFAKFLETAQKEIDAVQNTTGLIPAMSNENVIHYSSIPWIHFTSLSHARAFSYKSSIPKISFGKMLTEGNKKLMPVSIHVHHALMDGFHVGAYIDLFQQLMNTD